jgi:hypothetical protein
VIETIEVDIDRPKFLILEINQTTSACLIKNLIETIRRDYKDVVISMRKKPTVLQNLPTDTAFTDSPKLGSPNCICSRCSKPIGEGAVPIRIWADHYTKEYKYHPYCAIGTEIEK